MARGGPLGGIPSALTPSRRPVVAGRARASARRSGMPVTGTRPNMRVECQAGALKCRMLPVGCLIFGLYLGRWLIKRKALASEPSQDMIA